MQRTNRPSTNSVIGRGVASGVARTVVMTAFALGLYHPTQWSTKELVVDLVDKDVQAQGTGAVFDRVLDPAR